MTRSKGSRARSIFSIIRIVFESSANNTVLRSTVPPLAPGLALSKARAAPPPTTRVPPGSSLRSGAGRSLPAAVSGSRLGVSGSRPQTRLRPVAPRANGATCEARKRRWRRRRAGTSFARTLGMTTPSRLLIVDDEALITFSMRRYFQAQGFEVDCAAELPDAERLVTDRCYDVVIADLRLSGLGSVEGLDLIDFVRK